MAKPDGSLQTNTTAALCFALVVLCGRCVQAQPPTNGGGSNNDVYLTSPKFNPSMAIIVVLLISVFFLLGFFSIYIRQCGGYNIGDNGLTNAAIAVGRSRRFLGLDLEILQTLPTLVYSEVKEHKIGKGALECAICLNEFEDDDTIRLLPKCDHVFHQDCIDAWLGSHVTCPVCRTNYAADSANPAAGIDGPIVVHAPPEVAAVAPDQHEVSISVDDEEERKDEIRELARIATRVRRNGSKRPRRLPRSHSTGHSMVHDCHDRHTLRLPENVRKEIIASGMLQREKSFATRGVEGCSRKVSRGVGDVSNRRGRTIQLGRSDRWPSFFLRSMSAKITAWGPSRRGEEGSTRWRLVGVRSGKDWLGNRGGAAGGASQNNPNPDPV